MSASMSFSPDPLTWVDVHVYGTDYPPILALDGDGHRLTVSVSKSLPPADHVAFAQKLAETVNGYLAAAEVWAAARSADTTTVKAG